MRIQARELDKLTNLWDHHRYNCTDRRDAKIEQSSDSGIGTATEVTCGCGKKFNVTDYGSW